VPAAPQGQRGHAGRFVRVVGADTTEAEEPVVVDAELRREVRDHPEELP
jgi:hypothetical protein